jgi:hypothetical protein
MHITDNFISEVGTTFRQAQTKEALKRNIASDPIFINKSDSVFIYVGIRGHCPADIPPTSHPPHPYHPLPPPIVSWDTAKLASTLSNFA